VIKRLPIALVTALLLGTNAEASMTVTCVAHWTNTGSSNVTPTFSQSTGDLLVVGVLTQTGSHTASILSDTASDSFSQIGTFHNNGGPNTLLMFEAYNVTANGSNAVTATYTMGGYENIVACNVHSTNGSFSTDPADANSYGQGTATANTTGTITVTSANDFIFAIGENDSRGVSIDSPYSGQIDTAWSASGYEWYQYYASATSSMAATATTTFGVYLFYGASFKEPVSAGGSTSHPCGQLTLLGVGCEAHP
jgi:hypothetical protein